MNHYCRPRSRWRRVLEALRLRRRRPYACSCHLVSAQPIVVRGSGEASDPYVLEL
jgi:hypothetical protein